MRVLLVEDDENFVDGLVQHLQKASEKFEITVASSRDAAIERLRSEFFDIIVLDLKIPTSDGASDEDVQHGQLVFAKCMEFAPGTPVFILTGSSADRLVRDLLKQARQEDVWGARKPFSTVDLLPKTDLPEFLREMASIAQAVAATDQLELSTGGKQIQLTGEQKRVIKIFGRRQNGSTCSLTSLSGGLSDSKVLRIKVSDPEGALQIDSAAKISDLDTVEEEVAKVDIYVPRLRPGTYAPKVDIVKFGAKRTAGVFYRLANGFEQSLFERLAKGDASEQLMGRLDSQFAPWSDGVAGKTLTVRDVRRRLVSDHVAEKVSTEFDLGWARTIEGKQLQAKICCIHGDLHGGNLLLNQKDEVIAIDFGEIGLGASAIDPITLELSIFFHPASAGTFGKWMNESTASKWADIAEYSARTPLPVFIQRARRLAYAKAIGDREVYAAAYSYLLRQFKYPGTDKDLAKALLRTAVSAFEATF